MRISDWSSDVCSSDLLADGRAQVVERFESAVYPAAAMKEQDARAVRVQFCRKIFLDGDGAGPARDGFVFGADIRRWRQRRPAGRAHGIAHGTRLRDGFFRRDAAPETAHPAVRT